MRTLERIQKLQAERAKVAAKAKKAPANRGLQSAVESIDREIAATLASETL